MRLATPIVLGLTSLFRFTSARAPDTRRDVRDVVANAGDARLSARAGRFVDTASHQGLMASSREIRGVKETGAGDETAPAPQPAVQEAPHPAPTAALDIPADVALPLA